MKEQKFILNSEQAKAGMMYQLSQMPADSGLVITVTKPDKEITRKQFNALHVWCEALAVAWQIMGVDKRQVFEKMKKGIEIPWTKDSVKEDFLKPIMTAVTGKESTKDLTREEASELVELINNSFLSERFNGMRVEFPTYEGNQ